MHFVIAYDIADPRRLQKVGRRMAKHALRVQKSVFVFDGSIAALQDVLGLIAELIDPNEDIVQAWRIAADQPRDGIYRGSPVNLKPSAIVLGAIDSTL